MANLTWDFVNIFLTNANKLLIIILVSLCVGCSHNYTKLNYPKQTGYEDFVNTEIENQTVTIKLTSDSTFKAKTVKIKEEKDSLSYLLADIDAHFIAAPNSTNESFSGSESKIPLSKVTSLSYTNHFNGLWKGFGTGIVLGGAVGAVTLNISPSTSNSGQHSNPTANTLVGAAVGGVVGAVIGVIIGDKYGFELTSQHK